MTRTRPRRAARQADPLGTFARIHADVMVPYLQAREDGRLAPGEHALVDCTPQVVAGGSEARACLVCGADLEDVDRLAANPNGERLTCSSRCRQKLYRQRQKAATA